MPWDIWLIFIVLGVVVPWRGRKRLQQLLAKPQVETAERVSLYLSTIAFQWIAAAVAGWRALAHGFTAAQLGLMSPVRLNIILGAVFGAALVATLQWFNLRRVARVETPSGSFLKSLAERILPQKTVERIPFFALAVTAGVCEEFLYRGFAMAVLSRAGLPHWAVVFVSAILFGLAHLYQGRGGFVSTFILGLLFGCARLAYNNLIPVMAWHTAVDIVAGIAGPKYLIRHDIAAAVPQKA